MKRVLSVDDSSSIRQMVSFTLRGAGYEVTEAVDGRDGLTKAGDRQIRPDHYRSQHAEYRRHPIDRSDPQASGLLLHSDSDAYDGVTSGKERCGRKAGATGWIVKPFGADQLIAVARKLINKYKNASIASGLADTRYVT